MIYSSAVSNKGLVSPVNEDNIHLNGEVIPESEINDYARSIESRSNAFLAAVFDGMGGEVAGKKASGEAARCLKNYYDRINYEGKDFRRNIELLGEYVEKTNKHICRLAEQDGYKDNMGSTFACLYISGNKAVAINLGNSRVYLYRKGNLDQISNDHTETEAVVSAGSTNEEGPQHSGRYLFDKYLGVPPQEGKIKANVSDEIELKENDIFIICSDGLTEMLSDAEICEAAETSADTNQISSKLMKLALENGGKDNITAITVKYSAAEQYKPAGVPNLYSRTAIARRKKEELQKRIITIVASVLAAAVILAFGIIFTGNYLSSHKDSKKAQKTVPAVTDNVNKHMKAAQSKKKTSPHKEKTTSVPEASDTKTPQQNIQAADKTNTQSNQPTKYAVQRGDTLQSISLKFYGDRKYYQKIRSDNKLAPSSPLTVGQILLICPLGTNPETESNGINSTQNAGGTPDPANSSVNAPGSDTPKNERYYIVKPGDSLSKISEKYYGTKNNYKEIMAANGLTSSSALKPGQKLKIP